MAKSGVKMYEITEKDAGYTQNVIPGAKLYSMKTLRGQQLKIIVSRDARRWHLSISHPERYPVWDEIITAREKLIPNNVYMVMCLPPKEVYVNLHKNCFHLWQTEDEKLEWIMQQM